MKRGQQQRERASGGPSGDAAAWTPHQILKLGQITRLPAFRDHGRDQQAGTDRLRLPGGPQHAPSGRADPQQPAAAAHACTRLLNRSPRRWLIGRAARLQQGP